MSKFGQFLHDLDLMKALPRHHFVIIIPEEDLPGKAATGRCYFDFFHHPLRTVPKSLKMAETDVLSHP